MNGRVAFITGAASGLGRAIAVRLASDGFTVAVTDIDEAGAKLTVDEIVNGGGRASSYVCDVGALDAVRTASAHVIGELGGIDLLVSNAGFDIPGFFLESNPADWDAILRVDLVGVLNCTYAIAPTIVERCRENGYGRIVNIASDAGRVGGMGEAAYSAAKGGVIAFSKAMARELARDRVTVNAVCPGPADTPMAEAIRKEPVGAKLMDGMIRTTPLKRMAVPEEVAGAVAYLASEDARFVTGQALSVSGGLTMSG